ncbi:KEOPS complex subunit Pcc1 [Halovenus marina]|uniref:KEOPS complex subunit Pcc1 n=1 Tax=Halovenus marina TaxID=3396621 RepID=UPI003F57A5C6
MRHETVLSFEYDSPEAARRIERALAPEVADIADERSHTQLARDGNSLDVRIEARDIVALRAGLNTWLSLVGVAERIGAASASSQMR